MKYQSSSTHYSNVIIKVRVFKKRVKLQGQGHRVKNNGTPGKVLSHGILMWNIKALALTVQKLLARLKFQRGEKNDRQDKNNMHPDLRSREHKNGIWLYWPVSSLNLFILTRGVLKILKNNVINSDIVIKGAIDIKSKQQKLCCRLLWGNQFSWVLH